MYSHGVIIRLEIRVDYTITAAGTLLELIMLTHCPLGDLNKILDVVKLFSS